MYWTDGLHPPTATTRLRTAVLLSEKLEASKTGVASSSELIRKVRHGPFRHFGLRYSPGRYITTGCWHGRTPTRSRLNPQDNNIPPVQGQAHRTTPKSQPELKGSSIIMMMQGLMWRGCVLYKPGTRHRLHNIYYALGLAGRSGLFALRTLGRQRDVCTPRKESCTDVSIEHGGLYRISTHLSECFAWETSPMAIVGVFLATAAGQGASNIRLDGSLSRLQTSHPRIRRSVSPRSLQGAYVAFFQLRESKSFPLDFRLFAC